MQLLLERGADPRLQDQTIGQAALDLALQCDAEHAAAIVELLRKHRGGSAALEDADGDTSLARHFLSECYSAGDRQCPLHIAARDGDLAGIRLLLDKGHAPNAREPECADTPLIEAARMAELPAVELLLERGADPTSRNREGNTAKELVAALLRTETRQSWRRSYRRILKRL